MNDIIKEWLEISLKSLFLQDKELIDRKLKEECINHRLAYYLEKYKPEAYANYFVDIEYDKNGNDRKAIKADGSSQFIRPDILVHRRTLNTEENLLAIECKKRYLHVQDKKKLKCLLQYGYNYTISLGISYQPGKDYFLLYEQAQNFSNPRHIDKNLVVLSF